MQPYIIVSILSGIGGAVAGSIVFFFLSKFLFSQKMSHRVLDSQVSQEEAEILLKRKGFRIIDKQRRADIITYVDGRPNLSFVVADFIVEKDKKRYVAEVKGGTLVADATEPSTRRQMLEYKFAYKPDGMLLVDMIDRSIHTIDFEHPTYAEDKIFRLILGALVAIIAACVLWIFISIKIL
jgi:hypothetical protein